MIQQNVDAQNLLFIAYAFPPVSGPGVQRSAKFAKYLPDFGYRPLVLAGDSRDAEVPPDRSLLKDVVNTPVFRCRGAERFLAHMPRALRFLYAFWLRPDRVVAWLPTAQRVALKIAGRFSISAIYTTVSPHSSALLGLRLKKLLGVPWIVDFRDPWTDGFNASWPTKLHYRLELRQERRVVEGADAVIAVTPTMKEIFARKYPHCADKIHLIPNGFDQQDIPAVRPASDDGKLRIGHAGTLRSYKKKFAKSRLGLLGYWWNSFFSFRHGVTDYSTHSPFYLLHAVRALIDECPDLEDKIALSFAGKFGQDNRRLVEELRLDHLVSIEGYLPHHESIRLLVQSDVLFLPLFSFVDGPRNYIYTGKVFEYLGVRKPILAAVPEGDVHDLVQRAGAGWCVDPHDVEAIKRLLKELIERKMAGTLRIDPDEEFIMRFERREQTRQLAALFDSLLSRCRCSEAVSPRRTARNACPGVAAGNRCVS